MEDERKYQVYMHISPEGKRYIGATKEGYITRWQKNKYHDSVFGDACQKFGWENMQHVVLFDGLTFEEAHDLEEAMIAKYDTMNPEKGYNRRRVVLAVTSSTPKLVRCVETGRCFPSATKAGEFLGISPRNISRACRGQIDRCYGLHFEYINGDINAD